MAAVLQQREHNGQEKYQTSYTTYAKTILEVLTGKANLLNCLVDETPSITFRHFADEGLYLGINRQNKAAAIRQDSQRWL